MLALQDDRDLVVYAADGKKLWSSRTFVASSADTAVPPTRSAPSSNNLPPVRPARRCREAGQPPGLTGRPRTAQWLGRADGLAPCGRPYPQRTVGTLRHRCMSMAQMVTLRAAEPVTSHVTAYRITQRRLFPFAWNLRVDDVKSCRPMVQPTRPSAPNGSVGPNASACEGDGRVAAGRVGGGRIACRCTRSRRVRAVVGGSVRGSGRDGVGGSDRVVITRPVMSRPATPTRRRWCSTRSYRRVSRRPRTWSM